MNNKIASVCKFLISKFGFGYLGLDDKSKKKLKLKEFSFLMSVFLCEN